MKMNWKAACGALAVWGVTISASAQGIPPAALTGTFDFSADAEQALVASGASSAALTPASAVGYDVSMPADITLEPGAASGTITAVEARAAGGWSWQSTPNFTNTGGSLSITHLRIDVATQTIYGDASGANGAGSLSNVALWTGQIEAPDLPSDAFSMVPSLPPGTTIVLRASGLALTQSGRDLLGTGLGLNGTGQTIFNDVSDWGTVTFAITTPVPEPSTWALSAIGLAAAALRLRRRATADARA